MEREEKRLAPAWYALISAVLVPLVAAVLVLAALMLLVAWPVVPVVCYIKRRDEKGREF